jgi:hypothetical protein
VSELAAVERRRTRQREASARYRARNPGQHYARTRAWIEANREKRNAHAKVRRAVLAGKITRPDRCQECGRECVPQAHHGDYSKPLDVAWLCPPCHSIEDGRTLVAAA